MGALKKLVKAAVAHPVGWRTAGAILRKPGVIVLMYHRVGTGDGVFAALPTDVFAEQMRWLRANCTLIGHGELRQRARGAGRSRPAALVTFDDGYRDYHDQAYPVLKELGIPALVFVSTSFMDQGGLLWGDRLQLAIQRTANARVALPWLSGEELDVASPGQKDDVLRQCKNHLKRVSDGERRTLLERLFSALGADAGTFSVERQMLTWDEVRATMDLTTYGGHSHTHPILSRLDPAALEDEIRSCRDRLLAETSVVPTLFAYPNGRPDDFTAETKSVLERHGFETAFATSEGVNGPDTDWMAIKRIPGDGRAPDFAWFIATRSRNS